MISTNQYKKKLQDNRAEERINKGKDPISVMSKTITIPTEYGYQDAAGGFSSSLINARDSFSTGKIKNVGSAYMDLQFDLSIGDTSVAPRIRIKPGEDFDIGQFNGSIFSLLIRPITGPVDFKLTFY